MYTAHIKNNEGIPTMLCIVVLSVDTYPRKRKFEPDEQQHSTAAAWMWWKLRNSLVYEQKKNRVVFAVSWYKMYSFFRPCMLHSLVPTVLNKSNEKRKGRRGEWRKNWKATRMNKEGCMCLTKRILSQRTLWVVVTTC